MPALPSAQSTVRDGYDVGKTQHHSSKNEEAHFELYLFADILSVLVVGARNSGKTAFIDFLRASLALPERKQRPSTLNDHEYEPSPVNIRVSPNFISHYLETEMNDGERIGLTLWDSEGLDRTIVDLQLRELSAFVESKFEETFNEEMKVIRSPGVRDTHIHCVFLLLDPLRLDVNIAAVQKARASSNGNQRNGTSYLSPPSPAFSTGLDEDVDLSVLRTLSGKTTVVPIISKADTITSQHMAHLKRTVWDSIKSASVDPLEALGLGDEEDDTSTSDASSEEYTDASALPAPLKHRKHDSRALDERDEDALLTMEDPRITAAELTSHFDSASSSSSNLLPGMPKPSTATISHSRQSSTAFPVPSASGPTSASGGRNATSKKSTTNPYLPLSIISPDPIAPHEPARGQIGRHFPWGTADPYNPEHCDFVRLKNAVFGEWRGELREASKELWYEGWRTSRLNGGRQKFRASSHSRAPSSGAAMMNSPPGAIAGDRRGIIGQLPVGGQSVRTSSGTRGAISGREAAMMQQRAPRVDPMPQNMVGVAR